MHDVAIIGGGVSGCYCAFRLASDSKNPGALALYEASERIGGRLWSAPVAGAKLPAEIGGLFFRANQKMCPLSSSISACPPNPWSSSAQGNLFAVGGCPRPVSGPANFPSTSSRARAQEAPPRFC